MEDLVAHFTTIAFGDHFETILACIWAPFEAEQPNGQAGEGKNLFFVSGLAIRAADPISLQSGEGDMHKVPRLGRKVVRGFQEFSRDRSKARTYQDRQNPYSLSYLGDPQQKKNKFLPILQVPAETIKKASKNLPQTFPKPSPKSPGGFFEAF